MDSPELTTELTQPAPEFKTFLLPPEDILYRQIDPDFSPITVSVGPPEKDVGFTVKNDPINNNVVLTFTEGAALAGGNPSREITVPYSKLENGQMTGVYCVGRIQEIEDPRKLLTLSNPMVSRQHLNLWLKRNPKGQLSFQCQDLESTNGTFVTEQKKPQISSPVKEIQFSQEPIPMQSAEVAPLLQDIYTDKMRDDIVYYTEMGFPKNDWGGKRQMVVNQTTEHTMLDEFYRHVSRAIEDDPELRRMYMLLNPPVFQAAVSEERKAQMQELRDNLQIIGYPELRKGASAIADRIIADFQAGHKIQFFQPTPGGRSELFVSLHVLEAVSSKGVNLEYSRHIHPKSITTDPNSKIYFLDDFLVSGARTVSNVGRLADELSTKGLSQQMIQDMIWLEYIATSRQSNITNGVSIDFGDQKLPLRSYAHFRPHSDTQFMTGTFAGNDYGFENPALKILYPGKTYSSLTAEGAPKLMKLFKPYEREGPRGNRYEDSIRPYWRRIDEMKL